MKAVLDTNVLISAFLVPLGQPAAILRAWQAGAFYIVTSSALLSELRDVLSRRNVRRRIRWSEELVEDTMRDLERSSVDMDARLELNILTDDANNRVLEAAVAGDADYIVTGDAAFLALQSYEGIEIVTPARFLAVLAMPQ